MLDLDFSRVFPASVTAELSSGWWRPRSGHPHYGADLFTPTGTPVLAPGAGMVTKTQRSSSGAAGIYVVLQHPSGISSRYMHLSQIADELAPGDPIRRGQLLGRSGNTGASEGPHLHFDLKAPAALLPAIIAAVGEPSTGWGPLQEPWGYGIPVEPWLPVDRYPQRTIDDAKRYNVPLYQDRAGSAGVFLLKVALAGFAAWGANRLLFR